MKHCKKMLLAGLTGLMFPSVYAGELNGEEIRLQNQYIEYRLMQGQIYKIYVKKDNGVTTIQFPSKITEIAGRNISLDGKDTDFQIAAQPGSYYFNVSALKAGATATLTVTYNRKLYILFLIQSDKEAYASVVFGRDGKTWAAAQPVVTQTPKVTPDRLVSLLDLSKRYHVMKNLHPESLTGTEHADFRNVYHCGDYDIFLDEAIRFDAEDTIIFKLRLKNLSEKEILYDKHSFSAAAGSGIYYMSVSDATGIMTPQSETYAWFGITSTAHGGRNQLKADNDWRIALTTKEMHVKNIQNVTAEKAEVSENKDIEESEAAPADSTPEPAEEPQPEIQAEPAETSEPEPETELPQVFIPVIIPEPIKAEHIEYREEGASAAIPEKSDIENKIKQMNDETKKNISEMQNRVKKFTDGDNHDGN